MGLYDSLLVSERERERERERESFDSLLVAIGLRHQAELKKAGLLPGQMQSEFYRMKFKRETAKAKASPAPSTNPTPVSDPHLILTSSSPKPHPILTSPSPNPRPILT